MSAITRLLPHFLAAASATLVVACGSGPIEWKEEVRLQSGEMIIVKRTAKFKANNIAGGGGGSFNDGMTVEIIQPQLPDKPGLWSARFVPLIFDRDPESKEWFVVATFFHCDSWYELGRPKLPYTEYRFRGGRWIQQPLSPKWMGRITNILPADASDKKRLSPKEPLSVAEKEGILNNPAISPKFKSVTDKWQHGC